MTQNLAKSACGAIVGFSIGALAYLGMALCLDGRFAHREAGFFLSAGCGMLGAAILQSLRQSETAGRRLAGRWATCMAIVFGCCGFVFGSLGPFLLYPEFPTAPLLGMLVTGPCGAILGALSGLLLGAIYTITTPRRETPGF